MYSLTDPGRTLLTPRIIRASNASLMTLDGTRTYIVGWEAALVIDPGPDDPAHLDAISSVLRGARRVDIVVTHHHADHAGGVEGLVTRLRGQRTDGKSAPEVEAHNSLADGDSIDTDAGRVTAIATPGHTPDHLAFFWKAEGDERFFGPGYDIEMDFAKRRARGSGATPGDRAAAARQENPTGLFVGDLLLGEGETTVIGSPEGDVGNYLRSLDRVSALRPDRLFPGHGPILADPEGAIDRYRKHRLARVEQVRALLDVDPSTSPDSIVDRLYGPELADELRGAAKASVEAILRYLGAE